jgi:hypothetical protein
MPWTPSAWDAGTAHISQRVADIIEPMARSKDEYRLRLLCPVACAGGSFDRRATMVARRRSAVLTRASRSSCSALRTAAL